MGYLDAGIELIGGYTEDGYQAVVITFEITRNGYDGRILSRDSYDEEAAARAHVEGFLEQQDREARGVSFADYYAPYGEAWAEEQYARMTGG